MRSIEDQYNPELLIVVENFSILGLNTYFINL